MARQVQQLLEDMVKANASDLHLKVGSPPMMRIDGTLTPCGEEAMKPEDTMQVAQELISSNRRLKIPDIGSVDFSYSIPGVARYRVNVFHQRGTISLVMRLVKFTVPPFESLGLPPSVKDIAKNDRGIVIVTGVTGSGKSTTLASIIDYINENRFAHIVTIEDPIEFLYRDKKCIINQQELGLDFETFADALKRALRQDPDIILIGEMRDRDTIRAAITAAETGHLVLSTLHTMDATQTVDRIMKYFDNDEQDLIRMQLSLNLRGVLSQRLLKKASGKGRVPAVEVLIGTPIIQKLILEGRTKEIKGAITNRDSGMQSYNQAMVDLVKAGTVTKEEALNYVDNPLAFERNLRGGYSDGDRGGLIGM